MVGKEICLVFVLWLVCVSANGGCRDCATIRCPGPPPCKGSIIKDNCGCCDICAKVVGQKCGGLHNKFGKCDNPLYCDVGGNRYHHHYGKCVCPKLSNCARIRCGYGVIKTKDKNNCEVCKCKPKPVCPKISNCARIFCPYGVIKTKDKNGCEVCKCKPKPECQKRDTKYLLCNFCSCKNNKWFCTKKACKAGVCYYKGKEFKHGVRRWQQCNRCKCHARSKKSVGRWHCTRKHCRKGHCYFLGKKLNSGQRFFDGCNTCRCHVKNKHSFGSLACTKKFCGNCRKIFCRKTCRNGYRKDRHGCHICKCNKPYCTFQGRRFKTGAVRYDQCNQCTCGANSQWACTRKGCRKGQCYYKGQGVADGKSFFDGCNKCTCHVTYGKPFGNFACTKKACHGCPKIFCTVNCRRYEQNKKGCAVCSCRPGCTHKGKEFRTGHTRPELCNKCICNSNGYWGCTEKVCRTGVCYYQGVLLENDQIFFDGCNKCKCHVKKGQKFGNLACTLKSCPHCQKIGCTLDCANYVTDKEGCGICQCKKDPHQH